MQNLPADVGPYETSNTNPCPSWCDREHPSRVHRGFIGSVPISGHPVAVVILQTPGGAPSVVISGVGIGIVQIDDQDHEDMARLLDLCRKRTLAALVRHAIETLREDAPGDGQDDERDDAAEVTS